MRRCLLFDLDGTLTDPREGIERCIRHAFQNLDLALPPGLDLRWCIGPPLPDSLERLLGPRHRDLAPRALELYRQRFQTLGLFENRVFDGMPALLGALASRARLFVCTSKPLPFAQRILDHFGLKAHFEGVYGSSLDGTLADKAALIAFLLRERGLDKGRTLMIGDRKHDVLGAHANGVRAAGALWGYGTREELEEAGADLLLAEPGDLLDI